MKWYIIFGITTMFFGFCKSNTDDKDLSLVQNLEIKNTYKIDCNTQISEYEGLNARICLPLFFWSDSTYDFDDNIEVYTRYELEKDTVFFLLSILFDECDFYKEKIERIYQRTDSFREYLSASFVREIELYGAAQDSRVEEYVYYGNSRLFDSLLIKYPKSSFAIRNKQPLQYIILPRYKNK